MKRIIKPNEVLRTIAIEKAKPKQLPKVKVNRRGGKSKKKFSSGGLSHDYMVIDEALPGVAAASQIKQLEREYYGLRLERNKLSTQISYLVEEGATQGVLADHYQKIKNLRSAIKPYYEKIQHFKKFGSLPAVETAKLSSPSAISSLSAEDRHVKLLELKDKKRKLVDKRSKLKPKLRQSAKPAKPSKIIEWQQELDMANLEYDAVERQIKELEGKA